MAATTLLKEGFLQGTFDDTLETLYVSKELVKKQRARYAAALEAFEGLYGVKEAEIYSAPGRTEIGGNHTDHQNGKVLAASVNLDAIAVVAKREDNVVRLKSEGYPELTLKLDSLEPEEAEYGTTTALIRGVANGVKARGCGIGGFDAYVTSEVLSGSGLSSSAAFEVLIGNIFSGAYNDGKLDSVTIAQIGQEAENIYFGKPCGLMDQMACSVGGMIYIDFAEKKNPKVKKINVDFNRFGYSLCIVDTKGSHADLTDEYAAIPAEMKAVAAYFGKELLCQVEKADFFANIPAIRKEAGDRAVLRAMHWFMENERVVAQAEALEHGEIETFKALIKESGDSSFKYLQNVFAVKNVKEQGVSLALALSEMALQGKGVTRVHGGGFAGTIQAFVPAELVQPYKECMEAVLGEGTCYVLNIRPAGGVKIV